jgi:hypothetical protein
MEPKNSISFEEVNELCDEINELCGVTQTSYNYFSIEQELIETKHRLKLLEDRLAKLEDKEKETKPSFSMIPMNNPLHPETNVRLYFCDVNCREVKIDANMCIFMDDCLLCNICDFGLYTHLYETNPSQRFLRQFKNIKTLIIDLSSSTIGGSRLGVEYRCKVTLLEFLVNVCKIILDSNNDCEISFKYNNLYYTYGYDYGDIIKVLFKDIFQKSIQYTKLTVEVKNNSLVGDRFASNQIQPYINETRSHCVNNGIEFTSNIGV